MWSFARREIQQKTQLKLGYENARLLSHHNSFVMIANQVLGDPKKNNNRPSGPVKDLAAGHHSVEDAVAAINAQLFA